MKLKDDKRFYKRVKKEFNIRLAKQYIENDVIRFKTLFGTVIDISASGMLIHVKSHLEKGDLIHLTFLIPETLEYLNCLGKVIRITNNRNNTYDTAICFEDITQIEKASLNNKLFKY